MRTQDLFFTLSQAGYLLLLAPLLLGLFSMLFFYRNRQLHRFASKEMLKSILLPRSNWIFWAKALALALVWVFATLALMQPTGYGEYPMELRGESRRMGAQRQPHDLLLLIDLSASMEVADVQNGRQRLEEAQEIADQIISRLEGQNVALDGFTDQDLPLVPPTTDYLYTRLLLKNLKANEGGTAGTDFLEALRSMRERYFSQSGLPHKTLVILSDGEDTQLEALQETARAQRVEEILNVFEDAEKNQLRVFTVGIGSAAGGKVPGVQFEGKEVVSVPNLRLLEELSKKGRGKFYSVENFSAIDLASSIATQVNRIGMARDASTEIQEDNLIHKLYYQIPLGLAILLLAASLILPDRSRRTVLASLLITVTAHGTADDALLMQQAAAYDVVHEHHQARELYQQKLQEDELPGWMRSILLYDIGSSFLSESAWDQAIQTLSSVPLGDNPSPLLHYRTKRNLALAYLGKAKAVGEPELFENADKAFSAAKEDYCALEYARGNEECPTNPSLQLLQQEIQRQWLLAQQRVQWRKVEQASFQESLKPLLQLIAQADVNRTFLAHGQLKGTLKLKYFQLFANQSRSWLPLWEGIGQKIALNDPEHVRRTELFAAAKSSFEKSITEMEKQEPIKVQEALNDAKEAIEELLKVPPPPPPSSSSAVAPAPASSEITAAQSEKASEPLRLLLEMAQEDKVSLPQFPPAKKDQRPW